MAAVDPTVRLTYAVTDDNVDGVRQALEDGANPNGTKGSPALARAVAGIRRAAADKLAKKMEIAKMLLAKNADPNFEGMTGHTALYEALSSADFVKLLLDNQARADHKAVLDYADEDGEQHHEQTNLIHAAINADAPREVILMLRRAGADVNYPDTNGSTPLQKVGRKPEIKEALIESLDANAPQDVEMGGGRRRKTRAGRRRGARKTRRKRTLRRR